MSYTIYTWEDVEQARDEFEKNFVSYEDVIDDFMWTIERFCEHDFEGLYNSKTFYEDICFTSFLDEYIAQFVSIIKKCQETIEKLKNYKEDYIEHRSH